MSHNTSVKLKARPATFTIGSLLVSIDPTSRVVVTPLRNQRGLAPATASSLHAAGAAAPRH